MSARPALDAPRRPSPPETKDHSSSADWARAAWAVLALYAAVGGVISFLGWAADLPRLADWDNDGIAIQPNATLAATASGVALLLLIWGRERVSAALGVLVGVIGATVLLQYALGVNFGIDTLLMFGREWGRVGVLFPGRMGPPGATSWTLIGCALVLASSAPRTRRWLSAVIALATITAAISSLSLIGYVYGADVLYTIPTATVIAFQTSTFILAASLGLILSVPEHGLVRLVAERSPAGTLVRGALPALIAVPILIGMLRVAGDRAGLYDSAFGAAARTILEIACLLALLWWTARALSRQSAARGEAERAVEASEGRLRTIFETVAVSLWEEDMSRVLTAIAELKARGVVDFRGYVRDHPEFVASALRKIRVLDVNETTVTMFRATSKAELLASLPRIAGAAALSVFAEELVALAEGQRSFEAETLLFRLDGSPIHVFLSKVLLGGEFEGRSLLSVMDLTERKRGEEEVRSSQEALRESRIQLEADLADSKLLQQVSAEIVHENDVQSLYERIVDAAMVVTHAQHGSMQILQPDPEVPGRSGLRLLAHRGFTPRAAAFWDWVGLDAHTTCGQALGTADRVVMRDVMSWDAVAGTEHFEVYLDTDIRSCQSTPLVSRSGKLLGMLSTHWSQPYDPPERDLRLVDILARQAADLIERRQSDDALREADRRKDEFLMTLAHELRNPLAPVRSAVDLLKRRDWSDPELTRARAVIDRQTSLMARLLDDLLDVGRIARDRLELRLQCVELGSLIRDALEMNRPLVERFKHEVHLSLPPGPVHLHADPVRLGQVVGNLLNNACRYTEPHGHIWIAVERDGTGVVVTIRDSGIGIPPAKLTSIFDMFSQVDSSLERSQGGLGIGLHLVKRLVQMHGGQIEAASAGPGRGSTFTVRLPVVEAVESVTEEMPAVEEPPVRRRILVVDDNVDAAAMLARLLQLHQHETHVAHDGTSAIAAAESYRPDVVLLDIGLPQLNGLDVCRRIREQSWGREMVLIAVTGWGQEADRFRSRDAGFDHHIVKPVEYDALEALLAAIPVRSTNGTG